jgi:membrane-associated phospholipid phosphatase
VAWARVRLGDHTPAQTLAGAALGGLVATTVFILLR